MTEQLPLPLQELVDQLGKLPGLGKKSALRIAITLLAWPKDKTRLLGDKIIALREQLGLCSSCGSIASSDPCPICSDANRDNTTLCVVSEWDSLLALENGKFYHGQYLVLGGLLEPLSNRDSQSLNLDLLTARLESGSIREVILALGATLEAENTASFLKEFISRNFPDIRITRLAQGIPLGGLVKFMDKETLAQSLKYRHEL